MNISNKGQNGIRFLVDLAKNSSRFAVSLKEVSLRQHLSERSFEGSLSCLLSSGIIKATKDRKMRKFRLAKKPGELKMRKVLEALEGKINLKDCIKKSDSAIRNSDWVEKEVWKKLSRTFENALETVTLEDMARRDSYESFDWSI